MRKKKIYKERNHNKKTEKLIDEIVAHVQQGTYNATSQEDEVIESVGPVIESDFNQLVSQSDISAITTTKQLADAYRRGDLESIFEFSFIRRGFSELNAIGQNSETLAEWERSNGEYKKRLRDYQDRNSKRIAAIKNLLPAGIVTIIDNNPNSYLIYMALKDFSNAIHKSEVVLPYIKKHNAKLRKAKVKVLGYIRKLVASPALSPFERKTIAGMEDKIRKRFSLKGNDFPLMPLDFINDLGCPICAEFFDESILKRKLSGVWHFSNITFPKHRRPDDFLLHALQLFIYECFSGKDKNRRGDIEKLTARILNAFLKKYKSGVLRHLAHLKDSDIYNAVYYSQ